MLAGPRTSVRGRPSNAVCSIGLQSQSQSQSHHVTNGCSADSDPVYTCD